MPPAARLIPGPPQPYDEEVVRDVKAALRKMVIALARQAAYEDHMAAMRERSPS
jgi:hypothetical protein